MNGVIIEPVLSQIPDFNPVKGVLRVARGAGRSRCFSRGEIERLEMRIAPASVITYTDIDGDKVTIAATAGHLSASLLQLSSGDHGQLEALNLSDPSFNGASITFTVHRVDRLGDGLAAVGAINGGTNDFRTITVEGDLGAINCGNASELGATSAAVGTPALERLNVRSMGIYGLATQGGGGNLLSVIDGRLGALKVAGDMKEASIDVTGPGGVGSIFVGGSLIGGAGYGSGKIEVGNIGRIKIGDSIVGGSGFYSGAIVVDGYVGAVTVAQDIVGGSAEHTGEISSVVSMGKVWVGGSVIGGSGIEDSGEVDCGMRIRSVFIGGDVIGGSGQIASGAIDANDIGVVTVAGSLVGGTNALGEYSGGIAGFNSLGSVTIGHDILGGSGQGSGDIDGGTLSSLTIGGSLIGGSGVDSGEVSVANAGLIRVGHDVVGGTGLKNSGVLLSGVTKSVTIGGSLIGGTNSLGTDSGEINAVSFGTLKIGHDVLGGAAANSGIIIAAGGSANAMVGSVSIGGSLIDGIGANSGEIQSQIKTGAITIGHDLRGGGISSGSLDSSGAIFVAGDLAGVNIGGSIVAGVNDGAGALTNSAAIHVGNSLGFLSVSGSIVGSVGGGGAVTKVVISAHGAVAPTATSDLAIGQINVGGRVEQTQFLAGYDQSLNPVDGNAQVGKVNVGGDWLASDLIAGVQEAAGANGFGGGSDVIIGHPVSTIAKIASVVIKGIVLGTPASGDQFGFESAAIGSFTLAGTKLAAAPSVLLSPLTGQDVSVDIVAP